MATISDVAKEAEVSVATVSRVLNKQNNVKKETAERVYEAIEKLSFEPNILARNFRKNESRVILIITPNITNPYYSHILTGIGDAASELGYSALIFNTANCIEKEKEGMEMLKKKRADGAILLSSNSESEWLQDYEGKYPIIQCSEYDEKVRISRVSIDNDKAAKEMVEYLVSLGHRRIATISSKNNYISTHQRMKGYKETLKKHEIKLNNAFVGYSSEDYSFHSGKEAALKLLKLKERPTAIFCISDTIALGAIAAASELGIKVPEELSITGFDNVENTTMFHPYITTVSQPCFKLGENAMKMLYQRINSKTDSHEVVLLDYEFIVRESTGPKL
ncbi:MAG: LacI family DNA-binding transcriptional regulator [Clostridiaceae bacterium]